MGSHAMCSCTLPGRWVDNRRGSRALVHAIRIRSGGGIAALSKDMEGPFLLVFGFLVPLATLGYATARAALVKRTKKSCHDGAHDMMLCEADRQWRTQCAAERQWMEHHQLYFTMQTSKGPFQIECFDDEAVPDLLARAATAAAGAGLPVGSAITMKSPADSPPVFTDSKLSDVAAGTELVLSDGRACDAGRRVHRMDGHILLILSVPWSALCRQGPDLLRRR